MATHNRPAPLALKLLWHSVLGRWPRLVSRRPFGAQANDGNTATANRAPTARPHTSLGRRPRNMVTPTRFNYDNDNDYDGDRKERRDRKERGGLE